MEIRYRKDWGTDLLVDDKTGGKMRNMVIKGIKRALILLAVFVITLLTIRVHDTQRGPPLARWHTYVPRELRATELDAADWSQYLAEDDRIFPGLQPFIRAGARQGPRRSRGAAAWIDRLALQPTSHRTGLPWPWLCRNRDQAARARHRSSRPHRHRCMMV